MTLLRTYTGPAALLLALLVGVFPQSAAAPLMMAPFALLAIYLILSNGLLKLQANDCLLLLLLGLWVLWGLSGLLSDVPFPSKVTWIIMGTFPLSYMVARTTSASPLPILPVFCIPFAVYTLWQGLHGIQRPDAPFEDANLLGMFYAFGILAAIPNLFADKTKIIRILSGLGIAILLTALALTQSRSAVVALVCAGTIYAPFLPSPQRGESWVRGRRLLYISITALVLVLLAATGLLQRFQLFHGSMIDPNTTGRLAIWQASWEMSWVHPLTGFGLGTFHLHYPAYRLAGDNSLGWMVHMDPLQTAVESGWLAALLLYAIFAVAGYTIWKNRITATPLQTMAASLIVCFFVGMHLNYPLQVVPFLILLGCALAVILPPTPRRVPMMAAIPLLLTLLSALWIAFQSGTTLLLATEVQTAYRLMDQTRFDNAMKACINDGDPDFPDCRIMAARFLTIAHDKDWPRIETLLTEAEAANPLNAEIDYIRAQRLLFLNPPQTELAMDTLKHSLALNPSYWPTRRLLIEHMVKRGDKTSARALFDEGLIYRYAGPTRDDISRIRKTLE